MRAGMWVAVAVGLVGGVAHAQAGNARAEAIAQASPTARASYAALLRTARGLSPRNGAVRQAALELLQRPRPSFMARLATPEAQEEARAQLVAAGLLDAAVTRTQLFPPLPAGDAAPQSFLAAPGQAINGHHGYPGGLAEHTDVNVRSGVAVVDAYHVVYRLPKTAVKRDYVAAAALLHDAMKPWVLQWQADGSLTQQPRVAGTASHHPFILAEALYRRLPAEFVVVLASAHDAPMGTTAARVMDFLRAGALLAGVDPVEAGVLRRVGERWELAQPAPVEGPVHHLSDLDWALTEPAAKVTDALLDRLAQAEAGGTLTEGQLRWMRFRVQAQLPGVVLYSLFARAGEQGVRAALAARRIRLVDPADG